jgi:hypothetical protein
MPMQRKTSTDEMYSFQYVDPSVTAELLCTICSEPFLEPHVLPCDHTFCLKCMRKLVNQDAVVACPLCKKPSPFAEIRHSERIIQNLVSRLHVFCPNREQGCPCNMERGNVKDHIAHQCEYVIVSCSNEGCHVQTFRKFIADHLKLCPFRIVIHDCGEAVCARDLDAHIQGGRCKSNSTKCTHCGQEFDTAMKRGAHERECVHKKVPCPYARYGCAATFAVEEMAKHVSSSCPYQQLSPFIHQLEGKLKEQQDSVRELRHALQASEVRVGNLLDALQARMDRDNLQLKAKLDIVSRKRGDSGLLPRQSSETSAGGPAPSAPEATAASAAASTVGGATTRAGGEETSTPKRVTVLAAPGEVDEGGDVQQVVNDIEDRLHGHGTLVEFQWFIRKLQRPRGSLISPNFKFGDIDWQLSVDGQDNGIYLAAAGRGIRATYMISVLGDDLQERKRRNWVSVGEKEFGDMKWGSQGIMSLYYGHDCVISVAFLHVITPINIVHPDRDDWIVGVDSFLGTTQKSGQESGAFAALEEE